MREVKDILRTLLICVTIALLCLFGYIMLQNVCAEIFIRLGWETRQPVELFGNGFWLPFIIYAIFFPLFEELIFRFLLCKGLKMIKLPDVWVVVISAVIFMVYHLSWSQTAYQLIMGIFFAWIFLKTNQIGWTILMHAINNAFIVTYTYIAGAGNQVFDLNAGSVILALCLAAVTTVVVTLLIKKGIPHAKQ